jgi:hypothetical protein
MDILGEKKKTPFIYKIKMLTKIREKKKDKHFIDEKGVWVQ